MPDLSRQDFIKIIQAKDKMPLKPTCNVFYSIYCIFFAWELAVQIYTVQELMCCTFNFGWRL